MPQITPITLTGNAIDDVFGYIGKKSDVLKFRSNPVDGQINLASILSLSNVENIPLQRTRVSFKLVSPVTAMIDGVTTVVSKNEADISLRLSHFSTEVDRKAFRERLVDLMGESNVAIQVEKLESWY